MCKDGSSNLRVGNLVKRRSGRLSCSFMEVSSYLSNLLSIDFYISSSLGPQGIWGDDWSTRWNPNGIHIWPFYLQPWLHCADEWFLLVFAQQGYFMILINPTGSTTFGQGLWYMLMSKKFRRFMDESDDRIYWWYLGRLGWKAFHWPDKWLEICIKPISWGTMLYHRPFRSQLNWCFCRLIQREQSLQVLVGVDMLLSTYNVGYASLFF